MREREGEREGERDYHPYQGASGLSIDCRTLTLDIALPASEKEQISICKVEYQNDEWYKIFAKKSRWRNWRKFLLAKISTYMV